MLICKTKHIFLTVSLDGSEVPGKITSMLFVLNALATHALIDRHIPCSAVVVRQHSKAHWAPKAGVTWLVSMQHAVSSASVN